MKILNHVSATLSELDLQIARSVPPGGNWKNVPETVPSKRLERIRKSYAAGEGSRSTYYGRLHPDRPAYTINTYFNRPGNGCHLHYDYASGQHRVLSQREAARLQSFPDSFEFLGSLSSINKQIGNAVPPLLAYQIALTLGRPGQFVDLFSGAGGLSLGFVWAGWEPLVANDIEKTFLDTYQHNIHKLTVLGDIRNREIFNRVLEIAQQNRKSHLPLFVLGGPPCQGFSTAGNRRTMKDERNNLFYEYKAMLVALEPDGFVFENVTGILNMERGRVFELIKNELLTTTKSVSVWKLGAENYGIPQRRNRVIIVGNSAQTEKYDPPKPITFFGGRKTLFDHLAPTPSVSMALSDLPPLEPGEDGSYKDYASEPQNPFQAFVRSCLSAEEYLEAIADVK